MSEQSWSTQAKIQNTTPRIALFIFFWIWGLIGLVINGGNLLFMTGGNVGVGTSAFLALGNLFWIGGMVLFGLGSVMLGSNYDFKRLDVADRV